MKTSRISKPVDIHLLNADALQARLVLAHRLLERTPELLDRLRCVAVDGHDIGEAIIWKVRNGALPGIEEPVQVAHHAQLQMVVFPDVGDRLSGDESAIEHVEKACFHGLPLGGFPACFPASGRERMRRVKPAKPDRPRGRRARPGFPTLQMPLLSFCNPVVGVRQGTVLKGPRHALVHERYFLHVREVLHVGIFSVR